jgi:hypothetical protein
MKRIVYVLIAVSLMLALFPAMTSAHTEEEPFITDLIAGGGNEASAMNVGDILVWNNADTLYIKYVITDAEWCITETHLQVAASLDDIPQKNGNPIPGKFEENDEHDCVTEVPYTYDLTERGWNTDDDLFIAAHAVIQSFVGYEDPNMDNFAAALPAQVTMSVQYPYGGGPAYFPVTTVTGDPLSGAYEGWCVDTDNVIYQNTNYTANVYSSYETLPEGLVEYPENLDLVNWIINQGFVGQPSPGCSGSYTYGDVQRAIWALIEDNQSTSGLGSWSQCRVDEILASAQVNGEGFVPGCEDYVAVILQPVGGQQVVTIAQVTFASVGVPCTPLFQYETAWGFGPGFDGKNWATYIEYTVQGELPEVWPEGGTLSVAYEDLPIGGGNDWDYNDFVVDIDTLATFWGTSTDRDLVQMDFTVRPEAKLAGYTHKMHLDANTFACNGTYELVRDGSLVESGSYNDGTGIDVVLVPNTGSAPNQVMLTISFTGDCQFSFPEWDQNLYHGENLFYDPYLHVNNTGEDIHTGDVRMLTVPVDWQWPTPDANRICNVYPKVTNCYPGPPTFVPSWWTP